MTQLLVFRLPHWLLPFHSPDESIISSPLFMLECPTAYFSKFFPVTDLISSNLIALNNPTRWSPQHFFLSHCAVSWDPETLTISCLVNIFYRPSRDLTCNVSSSQLIPPPPNHSSSSYSYQKSKICVLILYFPSYTISNPSARPGWSIFKIHLI